LLSSEFEQDKDVQGDLKNQGVEAVVSLPLLLIPSIKIITLKYHISSLLKQFPQDLLSMT
jgi:hypothetical protein